MARISYTPFLKLKANEVGAVAELSDEIKARIAPFFDLPRKDGMTEASFCDMVSKAARKLEKYLGNTQPFYVDNFDIPDDVQVSNGPNYRFVIEAFEATSFIPVVGLDRTKTHNQAVFDAKSAGAIRSEFAAIRLTASDYEDFNLVRSELVSLLSDGACFENWILIIDCRVCLNIDATPLAEMLVEFINSAKSSLAFEHIVVTGSSVPASIAEVAKVEKQSILERTEVRIYQLIRSRTGMQNVEMGDYTIVSPMYSELTMPPEMLLNVTAPKVLYSYDDVHYIARGGALRSHPRGNQQYNDIAADLITKPFYRGPSYSYGDQFLADKAAGIGSNVTPGSVLKPTINAHITYMAVDHPSLA